MSTATATFRSQRGPYYKIQIISDNITADEDLTLAGQQPLVISFRAGEHKFPGFRSVECQITLLADKDMSYLYSNTPTGTRVEVKGSADGESNWYWVFFGYLEPFTYDQPYSLCNDEIVLTAIDAISILKFSPYEGGGCINVRSPASSSRIYAMRPVLIRLIYHQTLKHWRRQSVPMHFSPTTSRMRLSSIRCR
jgi:hypothetical protein